MDTEFDPALLERVKQRLAASPGPLDPARVAAALRETGVPVGDATVLAIHDALRRDVLGAGPLEQLLQLPGVTDVLVNGPAQVFVDAGEGRTRERRIRGEERERGTQPRLGHRGAHL